ncbi:PEP-CTERM sorting domain-containing protein [Lusitaniella coriacea]|uniref:PEP-CTERM sorting domain-containing protein n=1 Tax=Lusitaniella coriacea TaxID=1983105 RepID=UPI001D15DE69|nr:PEP-CTERM sorting domain-containing protein [Lusitaniella coriacea]
MSTATSIKKLAFIAAGSFAIAMGTANFNKAQAASIILNDSAPQTVAGQDFNFSFSPVAKSNGTDGVFTIRARGDYTFGFPATESLSIDIDGIFSQSQVTATPANVISNFGFNDNLWEQSFTISGLDLLNITQDSIVNIAVDLLPGVNLSLANASVEATLEYESVPEPASMLGLLAIGAMGAGSALKRKKKGDA